MEWLFVYIFVTVIAPAILIVSLCLALIFRNLGMRAKNDVARKRYKKLRMFFTVVFMVVLVLFIIVKSLMLFVDSEVTILPPLSATE